MPEVAHCTMMGLAYHVGQTCTTVSTIRSRSWRLVLPAERIAMRLRNHSDGAGETNRGGVDRQGASRCCLVETPEEGNIARRMGEPTRLSDRTGTASPPQASAPCAMRLPSGMITIVIHLSAARGPLYMPTSVFSNAPRARSDAFCASERPLTPVIVSRS
jgi:hypothetical protein